MLNLKDKKRKTENGTINVKAEKTVYLIHWVIWTLFFSFVLPVALSLLEDFAGTGSFFDEMGANYLAIIFSQAAVLLWTLINLQVKSTQMKNLICTLIGILMGILVLLCMAFFSPLVNIWLFARFGDAVYIWRMWILRGFTVVYLFIMILSFVNEWKSFEPTTQG